MRIDAGARPDQSRGHASDRRFWLTDVRLHLRINGREVVRTASTSVYVCAGTAAPPSEDCEAPEAA